MYGSCGVKSLAVRCYSIAVNKMFTFHLKETTVLRWDGGVKNGQSTLITRPPEVRYARATLRINVQQWACKHNDCFC